MKAINFVFCGIFVAMYIAGWLFPKFRRYIKKNIWLDNLPGVLELIFFINLSEYLFVEQHQGVPAPRKVKIHEDLHSVNAPPVQDQIRFQFQTTLPS